MTDFQFDEGQRQALREQFIETYTTSQNDFDASIRTLAAAGVAIAMSLATALHKVGTPGTVCVALFLFSLGMNVLSYVTAQLDMSRRIVNLDRRHDHRVHATAWTRATQVLNTAAGGCLIVGGIALAWFVTWAT
jgi:hypothetical protein